MRYKAILFDMDGTLLPMDMQEFSAGYFVFLNQYLRDRGYDYDIKEFSAAVWAGTKAMVAADGKRTNTEVFWEKFRALLPADDRVPAICDEFYSTDFNKAKSFTGENPSAREAVRIAHHKAEKVILATNPFFPMAGQKTRLSWVGLSENDFDHISAYETYHFCKPNPRYFDEVLNNNGLKPEECLMIGNDEKEDMLCATKAGIECWLCTDCLIPCPEHPSNGVKDSFSGLVERLKAL